MWTRWGIVDNRSGSVGLDVVGCGLEGKEG